jgi:hypothetical protein
MFQTRCIALLARDTSETVVQKKGTKMRLGLAFKVFFRILREQSFAEQVDQFVQGRRLMGPSVSEPVVADSAGAAAMAKASRRSEALTLLATLQREARLIDFIKEDLTGYDDAQIGAAVRDIQRDCAAVLERLFALRPLHDQEEGSQVEVAAGFDPARVQLTGHVSGLPPFRGMLIHPGWQATQCSLPEWTGQDEAARVITPAQVEVS